MPNTKSNAQPEKKPMDLKKLALIAAVTVVVVIIAILVDNMIRNPRCKDETGAINVIIQKVLPSLDEIADDEGFGLEVQELETIGDSDYYPVFITRFPKCEDEESAKRVVKDRVLPDIAPDGQVDLTMLESQVIEEQSYYVVEVSRAGEGKKEVVATVFVQAKNSRPYLLSADGTKLTPAAEQEELPITTIYVRTKNSQPFRKDDTSGQLVPYGG